jgi:hypothetical protein
VRPMPSSDLYCTRADVMKELPIGSVTSSGAVAADSPAGEDMITLDGHGLETGDPIIVRAHEGYTLPLPLISNTTYYAIRISNAAFKLAASVPAAVSGTAIDITGAQASMTIVREPDFDGQIEFYSRWADTFFPGHRVPFTANGGLVPVLVKGLVADLAAKAMMNADGKSSEIVNATELQAKAQLERFAAGLPIRDVRATAPANLSVTSTLATQSDPRGWGSRRIP